MTGGLLTILFIRKIDFKLNSLLKISYFKTWNEKEEGVCTVWKTTAFTIFMACTFISRCLHSNKWKHWFNAFKSPLFNYSDVVLWPFLNIEQHKQKHGMSHIYIKVSFLLLNKWHWKDWPLEMSLWSIVKIKNGKSAWANYDHVLLKFIVAIFL